MIYSLPAAHLLASTLQTSSFHPCALQPPKNALIHSKNSGRRRGFSRGIFYYTERGGRGCPRRHRPPLCLAVIVPTHQGQPSMCRQHAPQPLGAQSARQRAPRKCNPRNASADADGRNRDDPDKVADRAALNLPEVAMDVMERRHDVHARPQHACTTAQHAFLERSMRLSQLIRISEYSSHTGAHTLRQRYHQTSFAHAETKSMRHCWVCPDAEVRLRWSVFTARSTQHATRPQMCATHRPSLARQASPARQRPGDC